MFLATFQPSSHVQKVRNKYSVNVMRFLPPFPKQHSQQKQISCQKRAKLKETHTEVAIGLVNVQPCYAMPRRLMTAESAHKPEILKPLPP